MQTMSCMQIGKNGLTENTLETLKSHFKNHKSVKICLLKSAGHEKENVQEIAEKIVQTLGKNYTYKIVGFTIFVKKWRKIPKR